MFKRQLPLCLMGLLVFASAAHATTISYGSADGTVTFVTGTNQITVTLTSLVNNPNDDGSELSGVLFNLSGGGSTATTDSITSSSGGTIIDIAGKKDGSFTADADQTIHHWGTSVGGGLVCLETVSGGGGNCAAGSKPGYLIIGNPDSGTGTYTGNGLASIFGHNPQILNTATFVLSISGVNDTTSLSNVKLQFGTGPSDETATLITPPMATPEPSSLMLMGSGVLGLAGFLRRRIA